MLLPRRKNGADESPRLALDEPSRRGLVVICIALLFLLLFDAGRFMLTDLPVLDRQLEQARETLWEIESSVQPAPDSAVGSAQAAADSASAGLWRGWGRLTGFVAAGIILLYYLVIGRRRLQSRQQVTNAMTLMLLLLGAVLLASRLLLEKAVANVALWGIIDLLIMHLVVCLVMPWRAMEATLPFVPLLLVWAAAFLMPTASALDVVDRAVIILMSPFVLAPGAAVAAWRWRRRHELAERQMLDDRVQSLGGELSRARIVHDAMFPKPFKGHISFEYEYQPIQEIGGDYVHVYVHPESECATLTLLDVAGHGLAAALTVNRLFGELERILAENREAEPSEIIALLNRYIHLTMSGHSMFATGTCMRLDPNSGELKWVNAGHPPSLLRRLDGSVEELETTSMLLGVLEPGMYGPEQQSLLMNPGDMVIAFTDGAFEARNENGEPFGLGRLRSTALFTPPPRSWPRFIASAVSDHHGGLSDDDVLIATLALTSLRVEKPEPEVEKLDAGSSRPKVTEKQAERSRGGA